MLQLEQATIYLSNSIWKHSAIVQDGQEHKSSRQRAIFSLDESGEHIRLYVPEDDEDRDLCYHTTFPQRLRVFLGIAEPAVDSVIIAILQCRTLKTVDGILREHGIPDIAEVYQPSEPIHDVQSASSGIGTCLAPAIAVDTPEIQPYTAASMPFQAYEEVEETGFSGRMYRLHSITAQQQHRNTSFEELRLGHYMQREGYGRRNGQVRELGTNTNNEPSHEVQEPPAELELRTSQIHANRTSSQPRSYGPIAVSSFGVGPDHSSEQLVFDVSAYSKLLECLVNDAAHATLPLQGALILSWPREAITVSSFEGLFVARSPAHNRKVGAAGELFVRKLYR